MNETKQPLKGIKQQELSNDEKKEKKQLIVSSERYLYDRMRCISERIMLMMETLAVFREQDLNALPNNDLVKLEKQIWDLRETAMNLQNSSGSFLNSLDSINEIPNKSKPATKESQRDI